MIQAFLDLVPERVTLALITSDLLRLPYMRIPVETLAARRIGRVIGELDDNTMGLVEEALRLHLGLG